MKKEYWDCVTRRRQIAYDLHGQGYSVGEILATINNMEPWINHPLHERTIRRDLHYMKELGADYVAHNNTLKARIENALWDEYNHLLHVRHQGWVQYHEAGENIGGKLRALKIVLETTRVFHDFLGISGLTLRDIQEAEELERIAKRQDAIEAALRDRGQNFGQTS